MVTYKRFSPGLFSGFWVIVMIALWLCFAPVQAGGQASYIIVVGNSMEPRFHIGDLVIVHTETGYQVGDAVVYRNLELENFVFHRIIAQQLGRFTLQGDNNAWVDTYRPTQAEVLGKLWLHIPKGGTVFQKIREPLVMALAAGLLGGWLVLSLMKDTSKGKRHMNRDSFTAMQHKLQDWFKGQGKTAATSEPASVWEGLFFGLGLLACASLILAIISFSRPATRTADQDIRYDQLGIFAYNASAPGGVYDANALQSGDPIFPRLTCTVDVTFQYTLIAQQASQLSGTYQLTATIIEPLSGWQRTVPLQEQATFSSNAFGSTAKLDLCKLEALTRSLEQNTEFHPGSYDLIVAPNIQVQGQLAGQALETSYNLGLTFKYDRIHFYLTDENDESGNLLNKTQPGVLSQSVTEANTVRLPGMDASVPSLRIASTLGLLLTLSGLLFLGLRFQSLATTDPVQYTRLRYGTQLVDVQAGEAAALAYVDVLSMDDLVKMAEKFNTLILHAQSGGVHAYYVRGEGTAYRFIQISGAESAVPEQEAQHGHA